MVKKILIVSANPKNTHKLRLDEEVREIQAAFKRANNRDDFEIVTCWAVRVEDLRRALLDHQPTIVHFSGHGSGSTGLALENNSGQLQLVSTESLSRLFKLFQEQVECVVLNACLSLAQAEAIHQQIDYVIGMNRAIGDRAAIEFAIGFYDALGAGRTYEDCFELGCTSIDLEGIPESEIPVLKARKRRSPTEPKTNSGELVCKQSKAEDSSNGSLPRNVTLYISLESTNSIRSTLQIQNQQTISGLMPFNRDELIKIITDFPKLAYRYSEEYMQKHNIASGNNIYNLTLVQPIRKVLEKLEELSVIELVIEPDLQCLPWEMMHDGNNFLCLKHCIGRRITPKMSSEKLEKRASTSEVDLKKLKKIAKEILFPNSKKIRLLIVSMEDGGTNICNTEASIIFQIASSKNALPIAITKAKRHEVLNYIYSGQDIVHFTGHVASDGFLLSDGILNINMLNEALSQECTSLVVLNACETGLSDKQNNKSTGYQLALNGLNVLCTLTWITSDLGQIIASTFYENVLAGKSFGESLLLAKKKAYPMLGWWGYVIYGNPSESLTSIGKARENKSME